jgi:hypothetical protein
MVDGSAWNRERIDMNENIPQPCVAGAHLEVASMKGAEKMAYFKR